MFAGLIPSWAPNLHPLIIHFPIVLVVCAVVTDLVHLLIARPTWLGSAVTGLYSAGALAAATAYATGLQAESTVLTPGMAYPLIENHQDWALATTAVFVGVAAVRLLAGRTRLARSRSLRVGLFVVGLLGAVLVEQTAERGARLVYEQGVGVIKRGI